MTREPKNYSYWKSVLEDKELTRDFMARGNDRQKKEMKRAYKYWTYQTEQGQKDLFDEDGV
ncbi:MAG: hypothetical protein KAI70_04585 [Candidatus Omnitrophica bacterium]|nr:hypothetical protein [Candidatus Omnitrophota bacterium]